MTNKIFSFLKKQNITLPDQVNRLIVSAFIEYNSVEVKNNELILFFTQPFHDRSILDNFLQILRIENEEFDFEALVRLFEFVISPSEKIVNGAVYTPKFIREYIVDNCLNEFDGDLNMALTADIACGCGGFLLTLAEKLYERTDRTFAQIFTQNIYGIDIAGYSIERTKILLTLFAVLHGEDEPEFEFNLFTGNSLTFDWSDASEQYGLIGGFDIIVGNPPYVCSRNMSPETLHLLKQWEVSRTGHPDLYIPFFQIGLENLNPSGILGYITVNTFVKSINGRALREYFANNNTDLTIISFGGEQLFPERNTYTCICFLSNAIPGIRFIRTSSADLINIDLNRLNQFNYESLDHFYGWNLANDPTIVAFINTVENVGLSFETLYDTKNGIATLKNDVYKFIPVRSDDEFHWLIDNGQEFPIEIRICRDIINANKIKSEEDLEILREKIIFPYDENIAIIPESVMAIDYPSTLAYLETKRNVLAQRDKGTREYESWYAYGRRQSMDIHRSKLFFPHICNELTFTICEEEDLLFYNGMAIISEDLEELQLIKKILESRLFEKYIRNTTKDYTSGYISMSRNYLKKFGIYQFTPQQREQFINMEDYDEFLESLYGVTI